MRDRSGRTAWRVAASSIARLAVGLGACAALLAQAPPAQPPPPSPAPTSGAQAAPPGEPSTTITGDKTAATPRGAATGAAPVEGQATPPAAATTPASAPAIVTAVKFTTPAGTLLAAIKPDKTADFEWLLAAYLDSLQKSALEADRTLAASLKVYKATEPSPGGANVLYLLLMDPVLPDADYSWHDLLTRAYAAFPDQAQAIFEKGTSVHGAPMSKLSLTPVTPSMTPPAASEVAPPAPGTAPPAAPPAKPPTGTAKQQPPAATAASPPAAGSTKPPQR
jgi:hypothetical protein